MSKLKLINKQLSLLAVDISYVTTQTVIPKASSEAISFGGGLIVGGILESLGINNNNIIFRIPNGIPIPSSLWYVAKKARCQFPCYQSCETQNFFAQNTPGTIIWLKSQSTRDPYVCPATDGETIWPKSYSTRVPDVCLSTDAETIRLES